MAGQKKEMALATKVGLGFSVIGLVLISTVVLTIIRVQSVSKTNHHLSNNHNPASLATLHIVSGLTRAYTLLERQSEHAASVDKNLNDIWQQDIKKHFLVVSQFEARHPTSYELMRALNTQLSEHQSLQEKILKLINDGKQAEAKNILNTQLFSQLMDIEKNLYAYYRQIEVQVKRDASTIQKTLDRLLDANWVLLTIGLMLCGLFALILTRSVKHPVNQIVAVADDIANGKLAKNIEIYGAAEFEHLSDTLNRMVNRLNNLANVTQAMSKGDYQQTLTPRCEEDVLAKTVNRMLKNFNEIVTQANAIADGDYSKNIQPRSKEDALGNSLQNMTLKLRESQTNQDAQNWLKDGVNQLANIIANKNTLKSLGYVAITHTARYLDASMGAIYQLDEKSKQLKLVGTFSFNKVQARKSFAMGEGSIGQVAVDEKSLYRVVEVEHGSGAAYAMSEQRKLHNYTFPLLHEKKIVGVMELSLGKQLNELQHEFLQQCLNMLSSHIFNIQQHMLTLSLLNQAKALSEELTEQKEQLHTSNEKLEQASQYKSEFLASMSHELRTPLNSILVLAKMFAHNDDENLTVQQVKSANVILKSGNDLLSLINDILDLAKVGAGKLSINMGDIFLNDFKNFMQDVFQPVAKEKDLVFSVHKDPTLPDKICSDEHRLSQIIKNLLSNALKFTKEGSVSLEVTWPDVHTQFKNSNLNTKNCVAFAVTDTGIGIPKHKQKMVFEAFQQADRGDARNFGGTGLGLSISAELANMLGGEITLTSAENQGSTFTLYVPIGDEANNEKIVKPLIPAASEPKASVQLDASEDDTSFQIDPEAADIGHLAKKALCLVGEDMRTNFSIAKYFKDNDIQCFITSTDSAFKECIEDKNIDAILVDTRSLEPSGELESIIAQAQAAKVSLNVKNQTNSSDIFDIALTWPITNIELIEAINQTLTLGDNIE